MARTADRGVTTSPMASKFGSRTDTRACARRRGHHNDARGMRGWAWGGAACALVVAGGCALFRAPQPPPLVDGAQVGVASWYGPGFHGNRTANGEIYDQF